MSDQIYYAMKYDAALRHLVTELQNTAAGLAESTQSDLGATWRQLVNDLHSMDSPLQVDARGAMWRARCRLYDTSRDSEPVADSDPTLPLEADGETALITLPDVIAWVAEIAAAYHKAPCIGLGASNCKTRLNSFRTQLSSRRTNSGTMRLGYTVTEPQPFGGTKTLEMLARVDIIRLSPKKTADQAGAEQPA